MPTIRQFARIIKLACPDELHDVIEHAKNIDELEVVIRTAQALCEKHSKKIAAANTDTMEKARVRVSELVTENFSLKGENANLKSEVTNLKAQLVQASERATASTDATPTKCRLVLTDAGTNKIGVIKAIRNIINLGLKEAKDIVDLVSPTNWSSGGMPMQVSPRGIPQTVTTGTREELAAHATQLRQAGALFEITPES